MTERQTEPDPSEDPAISILYRTTRREEPKVELDAKILAEAKAAARGRRHRWLLPVSSAAVVLLGLTLTLKLVDQAPRLPQTYEDFGAESPTEAEAVRRSEQKRAPLVPAMRMDSKSGQVKEEIKLQKSAPVKSMPLGSTLETLRQLDGFEGLESDGQDLESANIVEDPADWLQRIQLYLDQGDHPKAIQELKAFSIRYPDYPLPEALQVLDLE